MESPTPDHRPPVEFGEALGQIVPAAFFGAILSALLVILRHGTPTATTEIVLGAVLFGGLGVVRCARQLGSLRTVWTGIRDRIYAFQDDLEPVARTVHEWTVKRIRQLAEMRSS